MTDPKPHDQVPEQVPVQEPGTPTARPKPTIKKLAPYAALAALAIGGGIILIGNAGKSEAESVRSAAAAPQESSTIDTVDTGAAAPLNAPSASGLSASTAAIKPAPRTVRDPFVASDEAENPLNPANTAQSSGTDKAGFSSIDTPSVNTPNLNTPSVNVSNPAPGSTPEPVNDFTADLALPNESAVIGNAGDDFKTPESISGAGFTSIPDVAVTKPEPGPTITLSPVPAIDAADLATPPTFTAINPTPASPAKPKKYAELPLQSPAKPDTQPTIMLNPVPLPETPAPTVILPAQPSAGAGNAASQAATATRQTPNGPITTNTTEAQLDLNKARAFVEENAISFRGLARNEDGSKTVLLGSKYGPVYVESGKLINGTDAKAMLKDDKTVAIMIGKETMNLSLEM